MSEDSSLLRRWWRRLFPRTASSISATGGTLRRRRAPRPPRVLPSRIEPLEGRIAPASLLPGGKLLSYLEGDGDLVTIHFSKNIFGTTATNSILDEVFTFSAGDAHSGLGTAQQLQTIDLTAAARDSHALNLANGVSFFVTVKKGTDGDGLANIGAIEASGLHLGKVSIAGDLGHINAGASNVAVAVQSLSVTSLGAVTTSQAGTPSYTSSIIGSMGSFSAKTVVGAYLSLTNSSASQKGNLGTLTITESLAARFPSSSGTNDGIVQTTGNIGAIILGTGHAATADSLIGGGGTDSGTIKAGGAIGKIMMTGNIHGGNGAASGSISAGAGIGPIVMKGHLLGGDGDFSGGIVAAKNIASVVIGTGTGAAILGGIGDNTAEIAANNGPLGSLRILGDLQGGAGLQSGQVSISGSIGSVYVSGSVLGAATGSNSTSQQSGSILSTNVIGPVTILGDLIGGNGDNSGFVSGIALGAVVVGGKVAGGSGDSSGGLFAGFGGTGKIASVNIGHGLLGGSGDDSGTVSAVGGIGAVRIGLLPGGSTSAIEGGAGTASGAIDSEGNLGNIVALGDVKGGSGEFSGGISSGASIAGVRITGSIIGGATAHTGFVDGEVSVGTVTVSGNLEGAGIRSGVIASGGALTSVTVSGHVQGGTGAFSGSIISAYGGAGGSLGSVMIGAGLLGGSGDNSGSINAGASLGTVRISLPVGSAAPAAMAGGVGQYSGAIYAGGAVGNVIVAGTVTGGIGDFSGSVTGFGRIASLSLGALTGGGGKGSGSIFSNDAEAAAGMVVKLTAGAITGGPGENSGSIIAESNLGAITASALLRSTDGHGGRITAGAGFTGVGNVQALSLGEMGRAATSGTAAIDGGVVEINGSLGTLTATGLYSAIVHAGTIGTLNAGQVTASTVTALGTPTTLAATDLAIARIIVTGNVTGSKFLAGYDTAGAAANGHAQIGAVSIGGNWADSDLIAGVRDAANDGFGNGDDVSVATDGGNLVSRIASVVIKGTVSAGSTSHGFEATQIGALQFGATKLGFNADPNQSFVLASNVTAREVASLV